MTTVAGVIVLFALPAFHAILDDYGISTLARERRALASAAYAAGKPVHNLPINQWKINMNRPNPS
jgi:hypothetical protein